jgi:hypothetical protein
MARKKVTTQVESDQISTADDDGRPRGFVVRLHPGKPTDAVNRLTKGAGLKVAHSADFTDEAAPVSLGGGDTIVLEKLGFAIVQAPAEQVAALEVGDDSPLASIRPELVFTVQGGEIGDFGILVGSVPAELPPTLPPGRQRQRIARLPARLPDRGQSAGVGVGRRHRGGGAGGGRRASGRKSCDLGLAGGERAVESLLGARRARRRARHRARPHASGFHQPRRGVEVVYRRCADGAGRARPRHPLRGDGLRPAQAVAVAALRRGAGRRAIRRQGARRFRERPGARHSDGNRVGA